jgi:hypothetical protein
MQALGAIIIELFTCLCAGVSCWVVAVLGAGRGRMLDADLGAISSNAVGICRSCRVWSEAIGGAEV